MSSFYLCDYCRKKLRDLGADVLCQHAATRVPKRVMHDGVERPTDVCGHHDPPRMGDADLAEPPALTR